MKKPVQAPPVPAKLAGDVQWSACSRAQVAPELDGTADRAPARVTRARVGHEVRAREARVSWR